MIEETKSDIVCLIADDTLPQKDYLKNALETMASLPDGWGTVTLDEGRGIDRPSHMMVDRRMIPLLGGEILHSGYFHNCSDIELMERSKEAGRYAFAKGAVVFHNHPLFVEGVEVDEHYKRQSAPDKLEQDRALLKQRRQSGWV